MTMIYSGNFSASIPNNIKDFNFLRIPVFYNNSKKAVVLKGKETYDRITEKVNRTIIISSHNNKTIELKERPFNLIVECARKVAFSLNCNLSINYKEIKNICFINVIKNEKLTIMSPIEIKEDTNRIDINITDYTFIKDDTININNYCYPVYIPVSDIPLTIKTYTEYQENKILKLNCINPFSLFPDEDCSNVKINIDENSYQNIIFDIYELQNFTINGMSDYKEWNSFILPEITFNTSDIDFNFVVDVTSSKIDIESFRRLITECINKKIKFSFNTIGIMSDMMNSPYICHPIFDDFFSYINDDKDAYDEIISKIVQRQVGSLYTSNNVINHFKNILSLMDIMPDNSVFFGMVVNDINKEKAHKHSNKIIMSLSSKD